MVDPKEKYCLGQHPGSAEACWDYRDSMLGLRAVDHTAVLDMVALDLAAAKHRQLPVGQRL